MNIVKTMKNEPRTIIAIINFLSFFLPWISVDVSVSAFGVGFDSSTSITGFGMISYSMFGFLFYVTPVIMLAIPFIDSLKKYEKYIYLILPIWSVIAMFITSALLASACMETSGLLDGSTKIPKLIGFWIAFACNVLIIGYTLVKDYNIRTASDLEENIKNINVESISNVARELGSSIQATASVECSQCGFKMPRGKKFCSNCGAQLVEEQKMISKYKCSKCGKKSNAKTNFCPDCGGVIVSYTAVTTCRNCGEKLPENAAFCASCGTKVEEETE